MAHSWIKRENRGKTRLLLLDRPPSNTLNSEILDELVREADAAAKDPSVRCLVLGSTSAKYFSAGLDLEELLAPGVERGRLFKRMVAAHRSIAAVPKPTIAAVEGAALLGGFVIALGFDWRYAAESAKVALSEVRAGLNPTIALMRIITRMTGRPGLIKSLVLEGKPLRAPEALKAGLVDEMLPSEGFLEAVLAKADRLAKLPPGAYASVKKDLRAALLPEENKYWDEATAETLRLYSLDEAAEGLTAMKEKRSPRWS